MLLENPRETYFNQLNPFMTDWCQYAVPRAIMSLVLPNIIMTVKMFLMIRAGREGIDLNLKMKMKSH